MNVVEFHTSNVTVDRKGGRVAAQKPDRLIFDLDPGEGIAWPQVVEATALMKKMLDLVELESFLKTSGGKGLHVVVPLKPEWGWDEAKDFSEDVVAHMARTLPQLFVAKSGARNRVGRIFIDYLRNSFQASTIAAFSARARPGLGVSVPIAWRELKTLEGANQWTIVNVHERCPRQRVDPWKDYATTTAIPQEGSAPSRRGEETLARRVGTELQPLAALALGDEATADHRKPRVRAGHRLHEASFHLVAGAGTRALGHDQRSQAHDVAFESPRAAHRVAPGVSRQHGHRP
jgi:DNA primase